MIHLERGHVVPCDRLPTQVPSLSSTDAVNLARLLYLAHFDKRRCFWQLSAQRANGRDAHKNIVGGELPFPSFPCLPPSSFSFYFISTSSPGYG